MENYDQATHIQPPQVNKNPQKSDLIKQKILRQQKDLIIQNLPHLYGYPWYKWAREFFESRNKMSFICAANQISKSSTQIRKFIHWATATNLWPSLWRTRPTMFWYLYPSKEVSTVEFEKKWVLEFLPRGPFKTHELYGWEAEYDKGEIHAIHFNTKVSIYFKSYMQDMTKLMTGTCYMIGADEELPVALFDELIQRLSATDGYYSSVFTAVLGQQLWFNTIERIGRPDEAFTTAFKRQVSMYDCMYYEDGSPSPWTEEKIERIKARCSTEAEIQRRVYGRFVLSEGRRFSEFVPDKNFISSQDFCKQNNCSSVLEHIRSWSHYSGVDIGSGGPKGHPSAIVFVAVRPDFKYGLIHRGWRGDKIYNTTAKDVLDKYRELRSTLTMVQQRYDWAARDFFTYASALGENFMPAEKSRVLGIDTINLLFKHGMLDILETPELEYLGMELSNLLVTSKEGDDFADAMRYTIVSVPWNMDAISDNIANPRPTPKKEESEIDKRRKMFMEVLSDEIEQEIDEYNALF